MFTGIIEETGRIHGIVKGGGGAELTVMCSEVLNESKVGDSIAVNGACLTITRLVPGGFVADVSKTTMEKTTLGAFQVGKRVNLERALSLSTRLGGHLVLGHVDARGRVCGVQKNGNSILLKVAYPPEHSSLIAPTGSISVDGVSLTVSAFSRGEFTSTIIPHTLEQSLIGGYVIGTEVNLEFDIIGKYVARFLATSGQEGKGIDASSLEAWGY